MPRHGLASAKWEFKSSNDIRVNTVSDFISPVPPRRAVLFELFMPTSALGPALAAIGLVAIRLSSNIHAPGAREFDLRFFSLDWDHSGRFCDLVEETGHKFRLRIRPNQDRQPLPKSVRSLRVRLRLCG
jgi:hypothetical protein